MLLLCVALFIFFITTTMIFWPKGNVVHEVMNLPYLWWQLHNTPKLNSRREKIRYGDHHRQYCYLLKSEAHFNPELPVIVYFHGGGWQYGSPENFEANAQPFLKRGHLVFLPSYRRRPNYDYYDMREDLDQILLLLAKHSKAEGISEPGYIFGGMSAGGNLAAHLALNREALRRAGWAPEQVRGLFTFGSVLDLHKMPDNFVLDQFAGPRDGQKFYDANPINYIDAETKCPFFCLHGSKDGMVPLACSISFAEKMQERAGGKVKLIVQPNGSHLDSVEWAHRDNWQRRELLNWLTTLLQAE